MICVTPMIQFNVDMPGVIQDCICLWSLKRYFLIWFRRMVFLFPEKMTIHLNISGLPYDSQVSIQSLSQRWYQTSSVPQGGRKYCCLSGSCTRTAAPSISILAISNSTKVFLLTLGIQLVNKIPDILFLVPPQQSLTYTFHELMQFPVFVKPNDMCFWPSLSPVR